MSKSCAQVAGREQCSDKAGEDSSFKLTFDKGILRISSAKYGDTYRVDASGFF